MAMTEQVIEDQAEVAAEDQARADVYALLSTLLSAPASKQNLQTLTDLRSGSGAFGTALGQLGRLARSLSEADLRVEYHDLFIGLGRGELVPYGSYYLTGFLQEKPLAQLRRDMATLGIARDEQTRDPEDHVAAVLEMMGGLITGRFGAPASLDQQKQFYQRHIAAWMPVFFRDLEAAKTSVFYAAVGALGRAFLEIEAEAFEMV
jgi:TorA maturation chaperone TorD